MKQVMSISGVGDVTQSEFDDHSAQHENGGADEISVAGLSGLLADQQTPLSHNHTSSAGDGGVLTNDEHDGYSEITAISTPSTPAAGKTRLYAKTTQGHTHPHFADETGGEFAVNHDLVVLIRNTTGSTLNIGQLVYVNGVSGNTPTVALADADDDDTIATGMVRESIANNGFGLITGTGTVSGLDTSSLLEGDVLYLSQTAGAYTTTAPSEPAAKQRIGVVTRSHVTLGTIQVVFDFSSVQPRLHASTHSSGGTDPITHANLATLSADDHTQYALLAGRSGGQTLKGDTASGGNLTLSSTNHATKGQIILTDEVLARPELRDHSESKATGTISAGSLTVDYTSAAVFSVSLNANITSFTISNPSPSGTCCAVTFVFTADGTVRTITWPSGTVWPAGTAPTMTGTNNKRDIITLMTFDAGTVWFGVVVGQNY